DLRGRRTGSSATATIHSFKPAGERGILKNQQKPSYAEVVTTNSLEVGQSNCREGLRRHEQKMRGASLQVVSIEEAKKWLRKCMEGGLRE
ncbi:hypothetical protein Ancab_039250, partial [Ancistrocladus abbreviatus]